MKPWVWDRGTISYTHAAGMGVRTDPGEAVPQSGLFAPHLALALAFKADQGHVSLTLAFNAFFLKLPGATRILGDLGQAIAGAQKAFAPVVAKGTNCPVGIPGGTQKRPVKAVMAGFR